jgi:hypothetical protein
MKNWNEDISLNIIDWPNGVHTLLEMVALGLTFDH